MRSFAGRALAAALLSAGVGFSTAHAQTVVRVAAWNVEGVGAPGSAEYEAARAVLARVGADVVGIQEIWSNSDVPSFEALAAAAGYPYTVVAASVPYGTKRTGFMSRLPILASATETAPSISGDPAAFDLTRDLLWVRLDAPGGARDLTVVVHHWKSGVDDSDELRRVIESTRIAQILAGMNSQFDAFVVMGDVNEELASVPRSPAFFSTLPSGLPGGWTLGSDLANQLASSGLFNDPFAALTGQLQLEVLHPLQMDGSAATRPESGRRLDYLMVSRAIAQLAPSAEVYDSRDELFGGGLIKIGPVPTASASLNAADHLLVMADLTLPIATCTVDADCDDGSFCNGPERCSAGACQGGAAPCVNLNCDERLAICRAPRPAPFLNELHYDNDGADVDEGVEVAGPSGLSLAGYSVVAYNGSGGAPYQTVSLTGSLPDVGQVVSAIFVPMPGLQNGAPDGIALVSPAGVVLEILSYEGVFVASSGAASSLTSVDIGVSEPSNTPVGWSLQRVGTGDRREDFTWAGPFPSTRGAANQNQTFEWRCFVDFECSDGNYCNGMESCVQGQCVASAPMDCDDGDACTYDSCSALLSACTHLPVCAPGSGASAQGLGEEQASTWHGWSQFDPAAGVSSRFESATEVVVRRAKPLPERSELSCTLRAR